MDRKQIVKELEELLELPVNSLKEEQQLKELMAWDSVTVLGVISLADEINGQDLSPSDFQHVSTVRDIINLIQGL